VGHDHSALPILVTGAGPTGLSLAITLRRFGVPVRIVDRAPQPSGVSKALAVWSGSLEALEGMQAIEPFLAEGQRLRALCVGHGRCRLTTLAVGDGIDSPYPYPLLLAQSRTEEILTARLAQLGVTVERPVEATDLAQDEDGVTVFLRHPVARHVVGRPPSAGGAAGARSFVRQALGVTFEGYTEPQTYLLCDAKIDGGKLDHRSIYLSWHNGGTVALFPFGADVWRVFAMRDASASAEAPVTLEEMQDHLDRHGPGDLRLSDPGWLSVFRINERLAARYRVGHCFLAGDAAHIHSPAGGQGMNTGIQDAVNLGWKLAHAVAGRGDGGLLLESYEAERRPIARAVVDAAAQKLHIAFGAGPLRILVKDIAVGLLATCRPCSASFRSNCRKPRSSTARARWCGLAPRPATPGAPTSGPGHVMPSSLSPSPARAEPCGRSSRRRATACCCSRTASQLLSAASLRLLATACRCCASMRKAIPDIGCANAITCRGPAGC